MRKVPNPVPLLGQGLAGWAKMEAGAGIFKTGFCREVSRAGVQGRGNAITKFPPFLSLTHQSDSWSSVPSFLSPTALRGRQGRRFLGTTGNPTVWGQDKQ